MRLRVPLLLVLLGCGNKEPPPSEPSRIDPPAADVPELEIRSNDVDRFTTCPPPGELGQNWVPPLPPWSPPPAADAGPPLVDEALVARAQGRSTTELAVEATQRDFRNCYRKGLVYHPTQDGRVAIVLRIAGDGRVAHVESYGACELDPDAVLCMRGAARRLRFPPGGDDTVTVPVAFTSRDGVRRTVPTSNDAFTAAAYVALETARPALHRCEETARTEGRSPQATGTFTMTLAPDGKVTRAHVDPWTGDQPLLACAARALEGITFTSPTGGRGAVIARLNFNPRQGTR